MFASVFINISQFVWMFPPVLWDKYLLLSHKSNIYENTHAIEKIPGGSPTLKLELYEDFSRCLWRKSVLGFSSLWDFSSCSGRIMGTENKPGANIWRGSECIQWSTHSIPIDNVRRSFFWMLKKSSGKISVIIPCWTLNILFHNINYKFSWITFDNCDNKACQLLEDAAKAEMLSYYSQIKRFKIWF